MMVELEARYLKRGWYSVVVAGHYGDGTPALQIKDAETREPVMTVTVRLVGNPAPEGHVWLKDWSENEGVTDALIAAGVVGPAIDKSATGLVTATLHKLLMET